MAKITLKAFAEFSHIDASMVRAVVRQIGGWESFKESAQDVANHGAGAGFSGFIYHSETVPFAKRHKKTILAYAKQLAQDLGEENEFELIAWIVKMEASEVAEAIYNSRSEDRTQVFNALAWFALEEVARSYAEFIESM